MRPLKNLSKDGIIILQWILKRIQWEILARINVAEDTGKLWTAVNAVTNFWVPQNVGNFFDYVMNC